MDFNGLWKQYSWKQIPGCAGRFLLRGGCSSLNPAALLGSAAGIAVYHLQTTADPVYVAALGGGGLISYGKPGETFIHTLNTEAGFKKKLEMLGIAPAPSPKPGGPVTYT